MAPKGRMAKAASAAAGEDFDSMTQAQLQARCKELGIAATGKKADLVTRLKTVEAEPKAKAGKAGAKAAPKRAAPEAAEEPPAKKAKSASGARAPAPPPPKAKGRAAKAEPKPEPAPEPKAKGRAKPEPKAKGRAKPEPSPEPAKAPSRAKAPSKATSSSQPEASQSSQPMELEAASVNHFEDGQFMAEYAKSSRSKCRRCNDNIMEGQMRLGKMVRSEKFDGMQANWYHAKCFLEGGVLPKCIGIISGYSSLRLEDQKIVSAIVPKEAAGEESSGVDAKKMEEQSKKLFQILDKLKSLGDPDLKELLTLNDYPDQNLGKKGITSSKQDLCADGILFGATKRCEVCADEEKEKEGGHILLTGEGYKCTGFMSEFLRCTFRTQTPERQAWKLTSTAKSALGTIKPTRGTRLFYGKMRDDDSAVPVEDSTRPPLLGLVILIQSTNETDVEKLTQMVKDAGGQVVPSLSKAVKCVISTQDALDNEEGDVEAAKELCIPGLTEEFVTESVKSGKQAEMADYLLWGEVKRKVKETTAATYKEKNGMPIDTDVGDLISKAHIYVDKAKSRIYSEELNATDMISGTNSFYTLYLLESDPGQPKEYWVFRKWGRRGVSQGGNKSESYGSNQGKAILEFSKLYKDKTGNTFGHKPSEFVAKPGKFTRIDVAHKALQGKKGESSGSGGGGGGDGGDAASQGDGAGAMGQQLSKAQIEKADKVLDRLEVILKKEAGPKRDAEVMGASAEYYSLIPHNFGLKKPPPINTEELLGAEKALLQFYLRMGFEEVGGEEEEKLAPIAGVMELPLPKTLSAAMGGVCAESDVKSCVTKGTTMFKKKAGKPVKPMSAELYASILMYTGNAIYKQLNKALREEDRIEVKKFFPYLRMLFEAAGCLPTEKCTLWRGISVDLLDQYKVGSTITWWGVSSCTSAQKVAQDFANSCGDKSTLLTVETTTACNISQVSWYANESESILLPGTQLKVLEAKRVGKQAHIKLKEVGRCVN